MVCAVRQVEIHPAEPSVPDIEIATPNLKKYESPSGEIRAELIYTGGKTLQSQIHKLINSLC
jgi:hypothetical protein